MHFWSTADEPQESKTARIVVGDSDESVLVELCGRDVQRGGREQSSVGAGCS